MRSGAAAGPEVDIWMAACRTDTDEAVAINTDDPASLLSLAPFLVPVLFSVKDGVGPVQRWPAGWGEMASGPAGERSSRALGESATQVVMYIGGSSLTSARSWPPGSSAEAAGGRAESTSGVSGAMIASPPGAVGATSG